MRSLTLPPPLAPVLGKCFVPHAFTTRSAHSLSSPTVTATRSAPSPNPSAPSPSAHYPSTETWGPSSRSPTATTTWCRRRWRALGRRSRRGRSTASSMVCMKPSYVYPVLYTLYTPFLHPLYTAITICRPMYTRYTCIHTIHTPNTPSKHLLNTLKHPLYALNTP